MRCSLPVSIMSLLVVLLAAPGRVLANPPVEELDAEGWIAVHALAFVGAIWLDNIEAGQAGGTDAAILKGGGVRVTYGIGPLLALECEGIGASSGAAELIDISGDADAIERQAKLGRVQCGGVARLGRKIIPMIRLGLGVQGVSHTATVVMDGMRMAGPDLDFELDVIIHVGVGLDAKLGDNLLVGAFTSVAADAFQVAGSGTSGVVYLGVHAGWAWNPN